MNASSTRTTARILAALAASALLACSDVRADLEHNDDGMEPPKKAAVATPLAVCPSTPQPGDGCFETGWTCELGADPDPGCNELLVCTAQPTGAVWSAVPPASSCAAAPACPRGDVRELEGTACALGGVEGRLCPAVDTVCACTTGPDAAHAHDARWVCARPEAGCPAVRPRTGQACSSSSRCDYGSCAFKRGVAMECVDGAWRESGAACDAP
jgi:hypothetical protein